MSLEKFFCPDSVAIIGAAREEKKVGHTILDNIINFGYKGKIFPVNRNADEIHGIKCYKSILEVPEPVDLAVIVIPNKYVPASLEECGKKNVKGAIIISAGFKEIGPEGAMLENEVIKIGKKYGIRILGPNCVGLINSSCKLNATFALGTPTNGDIAFMSQSGALITSILDWASTQEIPMSKYVSVGNKADIAEKDLFEFWLKDPSCKVISAYIEGINDGLEFIEMTSRVTKKKPVVVVKSGNTMAGARAVSSHTGTLAGSTKAYDSALKQSGIIRARTVRNMFDYATAFSYQPLPRGRNVAIITNAGGPGIMATDACIENHLNLATLEEKTVAKLKEFLPVCSNFHNPIDILGDALPERYKKTLEAIMEDKNVDAVIILLTPQAMTQIFESAQTVVEVIKNSRRKIPCVASFMGGKGVKSGVDYLFHHKVPCYDIPEGAVSTLNAMMCYNEWLNRKEEKVKIFDVDKNTVKDIFDLARKEKRLELGENESRKVLRAYKIKIPVACTVKDIQTAREFTKGTGYPVVLKIDSPDILHKTDVGGIKVGIRNDAELEEGFNEIMNNVKTKKPEAVIRGISIQEMIQGKHETIIGVSKDPQFGPMIMFGLGGIYVEIMKDVTFRIAPVTESNARDMIEEIKTIKLLKGARGAKPSDIDSIVETILKVSQLVTDFPEIMEMDINPLFVKAEGEGSIAGDVRIRIE
ncbi:MAG: acetate--CoA ligase family protein [Actinobacteria bacterium]|nr:acetate--CoA ligase family protein [Actinomycetota bacterium]